MLVTSIFYFSLNNFLPFHNQILIFHSHLFCCLQMTVGNKTFENIEGKGESTGN